MYTRRLRRAVPLAAVAALTVSLGPGLVPAAQASPSSFDRTSPLEARRVDGAPVKAPVWVPCPPQDGDGQVRGNRTDVPLCATVKVPLDYDVPNGPTVDIALLKWSALRPSDKVGSLLLNPGGPGGSGVQFARMAEDWVGEGVQNRFDIVGFDPRGIGDSTQIRCFPDTASKEKALDRPYLTFPYTGVQQADQIHLSEAIARGCSTTGREIASSMSTAQVARDMDVLRRVLGDKKLTYAGFSYGSFLGQVYANLFPDRFRSLVIDGIVDPTGWVGTFPTAREPMFSRISSPQASHTVLSELFKRCRTAGENRCPFGEGDPATDFETLLERLKKNPVKVQVPPEIAENGELTVDYEWLMGDVLASLYNATALENLTDALAALKKLTDSSADDSAAAQRTLQATANRTVRTLVTGLSHRSVRSSPTAATSDDYDNGLEGSLGVMCTDGLHARSTASWPAATAGVERQAPHFGIAWSWYSAPCAGSVWTAHDEDAYTGPFTRRTAAPVLVVGNTWDPATNHRNAVTVSHLLPNSRLLDSDNWGHCAYGTSACVSDAVDHYLVTGAPPAPGTTCHGDIQPYQGPRPHTTDTSSARGAVRLPPVAPDAPGESLN
jgi:pimeloyl-ACP methyl ester carboxylesterase